MTLSTIDQMREVSKLSVDLISLVRELQNQDFDMSNGDFQGVIEAKVKIIYEAGKKAANTETK